jgi:hypothetical protein
MNKAWMSVINHHRWRAVVMSPERVLLKKMFEFNIFWNYPSLKAEVEELLAQPDGVKIPESEDEAALMVLLGDMWLTQNAPHRLKKHEQLEQELLDRIQVLESALLMPFGC